VDEGGVAQVVKAALREDLGASLEPDGLAELDASGLGEDLGCQASDGSEKSPPAVDDLDLPELSEGLGVSGQTSGIPAVVTGELSLQVRWDCSLAEWPEEECTVWAVELNRSAGDLAAPGGDLASKCNTTGMEEK
jgi:hypothetical protein